EAGQQFAVADRQLQQPGVLVIGVELVEIIDEAGLVKEAAGQREWLCFTAFLMLYYPIQGEDIGDPGLLLQTEEDVVAKQQRVANLHDIPGQAIVLGADAYAPRDLHPAAAEGLLTLLVQPVGNRPELRSLLLQPPLQHLVGAAFGYRPINQPLPLRLGVHIRHAVVPESSQTSAPGRPGAERVKLRSRRGWRDRWPWEHRPGPPCRPAGAG